MNPASVKKSLIWVTCILIMCVYSVSCQLSLDQMIDKLKNESGTIYYAAGSPAPNQNSQMNIHQSVHNTIDNRFNSGSDPRYDPRISNLISNKILQLAHRISLLYQDQMVKNTIVSPISIAGAVALILLGANGRTFNEAMHLFGFDEDRSLLAHPYKIHEEFGFLIEDLLSDYQTPSRPRPLNVWKYMIPQKHRPNLSGFTEARQYHYISVANGIFHQTGFTLRPTYAEAVENIYRSEIISLDFRGNIEMTKKYINDWVKARTHGKIEQIVGSEINSNTNMIIASTLYFKALWDQTFIDGVTNKKNFYPNGLGTTPILVDIMAHGGEFPFYDATEYDCRILGFPYKGNQTTMYIILPNNSSRQKLREIQSILTPDKIEDMISKMTLKTAIILFPKLHIQNSVDLKAAFQRLGLSTLFDPTQCDLSLVSSGKRLSFAPERRPAAGFSASVPMDPKIPVFQPEVTRDDFGNAAQTRPVQQVLPLDPKIPVFQPNAGHGTHSASMKDLESQLVFSRFAPDDSTNDRFYRRKRAVTYKVDSDHRNDTPALRYKDFILSKRLVKPKADKKLVRGRRQADDLSSTIKELDELRNSPGLSNPALYADAIVHKIDLTVNEKGTEGGAATTVYLTRTGTDVVFRVETPFLLLIRHDATHLPLFYGPVYEPTD